MFKHNTLRNITLTTAQGAVKFDKEGIAHDVAEEVKPLLRDAVDIIEIKETEVADKPNVEPAKEEEPKAEPVKKEKPKEEPKAEPKAKVPAKKAPAKKTTSK